MSLTIDDWKVCILTLLGLSSKSVSVSVVLYVHKKDDSHTHFFNLMQKAIVKFGISKASIPPRE